MTVNKKQWEELAKKYPNKAAWVKALTWLDSDEENEDLFSALIELDPSDILCLTSSGVSNVFHMHIEDDKDKLQRSFPSDDREQSSAEKVKKFNRVFGSSEDVRRY